MKPSPHRAVRSVFGGTVLLDPIGEGCVVAYDAVSRLLPGWAPIPGALGLTGGIVL
jgi:hypothetical protein